MGLNGRVAVGLAPFLPAVCDPTTGYTGDNIGIVVNCGLHASRVVGKGGSRIHHLIAASGANVRVTRTSGMCDVFGHARSVQIAKDLIFEIIEAGDTRDLRAAISQTINSRDDISSGLVIATPGFSRHRSGLRWEENTTPKYKSDLFVSPKGSTDLYSVPLILQ